MDSAREAIVNQECQKVAERIKVHIMRQPDAFWGKCEINFQEDLAHTINVRYSDNLRKATI